MSGFQMDVFVDAESLQRVRNMLAFQVALDKRMKTAMSNSLGFLQTEAQTWMWDEFIDPQGPLENAFVQDVYGADEAELSNPLAYAFRRNYGFSEKTDSLNRYFPLDPGIAYMQMAIKNAWDAVYGEFDVAFDLALKDVGAL